MVSSKKNRSLRIYSKKSKSKRSLRSNGGSGEQLSLLDIKSITLKFKNHKGEQVFMGVDVGDDIWDAVLRIWQIFGFPRNDIKLRYKGKVLDETVPFYFYSALFLHEYGEVPIEVELIELKENNVLEKFKKYFKEEDDKLKRLTYEADGANMVADVSMNASRNQLHTQLERGATSASEVSLAYADAYKHKIIEQEVKKKTMSDYVLLHEQSIEEMLEQREKDAIKVTNNSRKKHPRLHLWYETQLNPFKGNQEPVSGVYRINIKLLGGKSFTLSFDSTREHTTIKTLFERLEDYSGISSERMHLAYGGFQFTIKSPEKELNSTFESWNIGDGATLHMRVRSGGTEEERAQELNDFYEALTKRHQIEDRDRRIQENHEEVFKLHCIADGAEKVRDHISSFASVARIDAEKDFSKGVEYVLEAVAAAAANLRLHAVTTARQLGVQ